MSDKLPPDKQPLWWIETSMTPADMSATGVDDAKATPQGAAAAPGAALSESLMPIPPEKLDEMIKALQSSLDARGEDLQHENLEVGDHSDDEDDALTAARKHHSAAHPTKKRLMTIADLPPSDDFFFQASPTPPPDDVILQTGRRLRDGARMHAISAPFLGLHRPLYISDCLLPVACFAAVLVVTVVSAVGQYRTMQNKLRAQEAHHAAAQQRKYDIMEAMCHKLLQLQPTSSYA
jgi:hypothetical protein